MALTTSELDPSDGLGDLLGVAIDAAEPRIGEPAGWAQVTSERERRPDDAPMTGELADWGNSGAQFVTERCESLEHARERAYELLGPERHWRAAVVWMTAAAVLVQAQDAESDEVSAVWTVPIRRRRWRAPTLDRFGGPLWVQAPPLRAPTWNGTRWTLRSRGGVVAELVVDYTWGLLLYGSITPRAGFEEVRPILEQYASIVESHGRPLHWVDGPPEDVSAALAAMRDAVSLHDPDEQAIDDYELRVNGSRAMWWWPEPE